MVLMGQSSMSSPQRIQTLPASLTKWFRMCHLWQPFVSWCIMYMKSHVVDSAWFVEFLLDHSQLRGTASPIAQNDPGMQKKTGNGWKWPGKTCQTNPNDLFISLEPWTNWRKLTTATVDVSGVWHFAKSRHLSTACHPLAKAFLEKWSPRTFEWNLPAPSRSASVTTKLSVFQTITERKHQEVSNRYANALYVYLNIYIYTVYITLYNYIQCIYRHFKQKKQKYIEIPKTLSKTMQISLWAKRKCQLPAEALWLDVPQLRVQSVQCSLCLDTWFRGRHLRRKKRSS